MILGIGMGQRMDVAWQDVAGANLDTCHPVMEITGRAKGCLDQMTPTGHKAVVHVTLPDDNPWAQAFVVIGARPLNPE